ncbi:uncharacterized protein ACRADG_005986 [Cochliomyia hominivorax]
MDIKVKLEPMEVPNSSASETQIKVEIKHEKELLIEEENHWLPVKYEDEENQYYQDFAGSNGQDGYFEEANDNEPYYEHYTIEYINKNQDYDSDEDDDDEESDGTEEVESVDIEYNLDLNNYIQKQAEASESLMKEKSVFKIDFCKQSFHKWLLRFYIQRECPGCKHLFDYYDKWRRHILKVHKELIKESDMNYLKNDKKHICKKCNRELVSKFACLSHTLRHREDSHRLDVNICKLCNFESDKNHITLLHFLEMHSDIVDKFKRSDGTNEILVCPICDNSYKKYIYLTYHMKDKHPEEYYYKYIYKCHLCKFEDFKSEELYFQHLIKEHGLNCWSLLNFRQIFDDKEYLACLDCHRVFLENDTHKLLKHFLEHNNNFYWCCKFCNEKISFKKSCYNSHTCIKMMLYYAQQRRGSKKPLNDDEKTGLNSLEKKQKLQNLQDFEEYILHICPFCRKDFDKMTKWQEHLRNQHEIDTLKGLEMKVITSDNNKLRCVICHTTVTNCPEQLHAHRFQHLPYNPYKCRHCSTNLSTFKIALNHILKRCNDKENKDIKNLATSKSNVPMEVVIQCPFCNNQKFNNTNSILKHLEEVHNNFDYFFIIHADNSRSCKVCNNIYLKYDKKTCYDHIHQHFDKRFYKCPMCDNSYTSYNICKHHIIYKHYAKPLNQLMKTNEKIDISLNKETKEEISNEPSCVGRSSANSYVLNEFVEFITFACPECNEGFLKHEEWSKHITTKHNFFEKSNMYFKDTDGSLKCTTCKMTLSTSTIQQQRHKLTHMPYRSFMCSLCYTRFNSLGILYGHHRRKHFASGSFKCPICSEILSTDYQRAEHIKNQHSRSEWPRNMCLICYKILARKFGLTTHMNTHDIDRVKHTCEICGSKLVGAKDFKLHLLRHKERGEIEKPKENNLNSHSGSKKSEESLTEDIKLDLCKEDDKIESISEEKTVCNKRKSQSISLKINYNKINRTNSHS